MPAEIETVPGPRKAAIFLATMGADVSAKIFKNLDESDIETLTAEISQLPIVDDEITSAVLAEFLQMALTNQYITTGGINYAVEILDKALGRNRAVEVVNRVQSAFQPTGFAAVKKADPNHLVSILRREHPQTVALVLANLEAPGAAAVLSGLPEDVRPEVVLRLATIDKTSPEVLKQVERVLEKQVSAGMTSGVSFIGGSKTVAGVLNQVDPATQKAILDRLDESQPNLAEQIRALMFTFEDLISVDDRGIQQIIQEVDQKQLVLALKGSGEEMAAKIFKNMSERTASIVKQEIDFLGPVRLKDVEEAQRKVVSVAKKLEEAGEIILSKGGAGDQIVG